MRGNTYHARARKRIPAETQSISLLDLIPLVLERFVVHLDQCGGAEARYHFRVDRELRADLAVVELGPKHDCLM